MSVSPPTIPEGIFLSVCEEVGRRTYPDSPQDAVAYGKVAAFTWLTVLAQIAHTQGPDAVKGAMCVLARAIRPDGGALVSAIETSGGSLILVNASSDAAAPAALRNVARELTRMAEMAQRDPTDPSPN